MSHDPHSPAEAVLDDPHHTYDLRPRVEGIEAKVNRLESMLQDLLTVNKGIEVACEQTGDVIEKLEAKYAGLEARLRAEKGAIPMDRGMKLYPEGDMIPSKSVHDLSDGKTYIIDGVVLAFVKNTTKSFLRAGESYRCGKIDTQLRSEAVEPNNFAYLEFEPGAL
jgi:hypothetical protein